MRRFIAVLIGLYGSLLRLYPCSFREKFEQEMFLDFTDMVEEASKRGATSLIIVLLRELRDFAPNLIVAHLQEDAMSEVFRAGPARAAIQSALALSLALITMFTTVQLISTAMYGQGWLFLMRTAKSLGLYLDYGLAAQLTLSYLIYIVGAALAGTVLALCLWEPRRIKRYLLAGVLGWAAPLLFVRTVGSLLINDSETVRNTVLDYSWIILAGLGFGAVFSLILQDRKKTLWLLLVGVLGYFIAQKLAMWLILPLFPTYYVEAFSWRDLVYIVGWYSVMGTIIGVLLGAVAGWSRQKTISSGAT